MVDDSRMGYLQVVSRAEWSAIIRSLRCSSLEEGGLPPLNAGAQSSPVGNRPRFIAQGDIQCVKSPHRTALPQTKNPQPQASE